MKQIFILGAGQSTTYLIHRLLDVAEPRDWFITVADADLELARARVADHPRGRAVAVDVNDAASRSTWIEKSDVVVNIIPARFQSLVALDCVRHGRPMFSVSYRDRAMRDLHSDAERNNTLLLCELGLDPGIDHMSAMSLIDRLHAEGGHITSFCSYGSGIPAPDQPQNPLRYVITWNPRNVVMASEFGAQYMENGRIKIVPWHHVFHHTWSVDVDGLGMLEAYPNRDSLTYMQAFGLEHVHTMIRGTLRWPGWCETWAKVVSLGLPNEEIRIPDLAERTYAEVVEMFLPLNVEGPSSLEHRVAAFLRISPTGRIMENLRWMGLFSDEATGCHGDTGAAMLIDLLSKKLPLTDELRDMVILVHDLEVEYEDPSRAPERVTSTMVARGEAGGFTAMAKSVGMPVYIGIELLLSGQIELKGCHIPTHRSIYEPQLRALAKDGLAFVEKRRPLE